MTTLVTTWEEWCQVFNQLGFWQEEIEGICARHNIPIQGITATFPGTHAVFEINHELILKIFCPVQYNSCEVELRVHQDLFRNKSLFPQALFHGHSPVGYDYLIFNTMPGKPLRELGIEALHPHSIFEVVEAILSWQSDTLKQSPTGELTCLVHLFTRPLIRG